MTIDVDVRPPKDDNIQDGHPANDLVGHLKSLLVKVREELGITPIDTILTEEHFGEDIPSLPQRFLSKGGVAQNAMSIRLAFEVAIRDILLELLVQRPSNDDEFLSNIANLLDLTFLINKHSLSDIRLFYEMVEEFFDSQPINVLKSFFRYLEVRVNRINIDMNGEGGRGPTLLRLCNTLLRRLSKAEDTIFAGRILIYLSQSFPLCERSGMNIRGEFHTDNVTEYDKDVVAPPAATPAPETDEAMTDVTPPSDDKLAPPSTEPKAAKKKEEEDVHLDTLYPIFWNLQSYFSDPSKLFESEENFEEFKTGLMLTLNKFKKMGNSNSKASELEEKKGAPSTPSLAPAVMVGSSPATTLLEKRKRESETTSEHFNPKYLTGRELFELEIQDLTFQRHILVQAIILIDYLLTLTPESKAFYTSQSTLYSRLSTLNIGTLTPANETWCHDTKAAIQTYLSPNRDGLLFVRTIETILQRDKNWTRWKMKGGKTFERPPISATDLTLITYNAKQFCTPLSKYPHLMGTPSLSRLWRDSSTSGLNGLKQRIATALPTPASFQPKIKTDLDEIAAPFSDEDFEAAVENKNIKMWRAMRLASKSHFTLFNKIEDKLNEWRVEEIKRMRARVAEEGGDVKAVVVEEKVEGRDDLRALLECEVEDRQRREEERERRRKIREGIVDEVETQKENEEKEGTPAEEERDVKKEEGVLSPRKRHLEVQDAEMGEAKRRKSTPPRELETKEVEMAEEGGGS